MPTEQAVRAVLAESRNGMNYAVRVGLYSMVASDGAVELAQAAQCFWLFDILGTELAPKLLKDINADEVGSIWVHLSVLEDNGCGISATSGGREYWRREVSYTSFPVGDWDLFEMGPLTYTEDGRAKGIVCCLVSEH